MRIKEGVERVLDYIFPRLCVSCAKEGTWWCESCSHSVERAIPVCVGCKEQNENGETCLPCKAVQPLDGLTAFFNYQTPAVSELVALLKYGFVTDIRLVLKNFLCLPPGAVWAHWAVVPVPLFLRRERERGFNQAAIIAEILAEAGGIPVYHAVRRVRKTKQQARLYKEERQANIVGAFEVQNKHQLPESVLLVDDVFTTGATMNECARMLKTNGVQHVWGVVIARD